MTVKADPTNRLIESSETNNEATKALTILTRPDLAVPSEPQGITPSDVEPIKGDAVTVTVAQKNSGQTDAPASVLALYDGAPDAGGTKVGESALTPVPAGGQVLHRFTWTPDSAGPHRLFTVSDRPDTAGATAVNESDEGNNQTWRDVYVGLPGPLRPLEQVAAADEPAYSTERGYGLVTQNRSYAVDPCGGAGPHRHELLRRGVDGKIEYRFDHLQTGHSYHLDVVMFECDGAPRVQTVKVDTVAVNDPVNLAAADASLSIRLDPVLYAADHSITVLIEAPGIDGAVVRSVKLYDIDYRYADAGGPADAEYTATRCFEAVRCFGWLADTGVIASTAWGTLPHQSVRVNQSSNRVRYQFDQLAAGHQYLVRLSFSQNSSVTRRQKVQINDADVGGAFDVPSGPNSLPVNVLVPQSAYQSDRSIEVAVVRTDPNATTGAFVSEIALEQLTDVPPKTPSALSMVSGDGQSAGQGATLANPLVVEVKNAGIPPSAVAGVPVTFCVTGPASASLSGGVSSGPCVTLSTDSSGRASVNLTLGAALGDYTVTATCADCSDPAKKTVPFTATAVSDGPATLEELSGDNQIGAPGAVLPRSLEVRTLRSNAIPAPGAAVTFAVTGFPTDAAGQQVTPLGLVTDAQGQLSATLKLGDKPGVYTVTATCTECSGTPKVVTFTARVLPPGWCSAWSRIQRGRAGAARRWTSRSWWTPVSSRWTRSKCGFTTT